MRGWHVDGSESAVAGGRASLGAAAALAGGLIALALALGSPESGSPARAAQPETAFPGLAGSLDGSDGHRSAGAGPLGVSSPAWEQQSSPTDLTLRGVDCVDSQHCWVVGGEGEFNEKLALLRTENGGEHWGMIGVEGAKRMDSVDFVDSEVGWIVGVDGLIFRTDDGGRSWRRQESGVTNRRLTHVQFLDRDYGWITFLREAALLKTTDGGETWTKLPIVVIDDPDEDVDVDEGLSTIFMLNRLEGWAHGTDEVLLHTVDGGLSWENQVSGTDRRLYGVTFVDPLLGWIVGSDIRKTTDGGRTWVFKQKPPNTLHEVHFIDRLTGWSVGDKGAIMYTVDGGETWSREAMEFGERSYNDFSLGGPDNLWVVGTGGTILHRHDPALRPTETPTPTFTPTPTSTPTPTNTPTPTPAGPWVQLYDPAVGDPDFPLLLGRTGGRSVAARYGNADAAVAISVTLGGAAMFGDGGTARLVDLPPGDAAGLVLVPGISASPAEAVFDEVSVRAELVDEAGAAVGAGDAFDVLVGLIARTLNLPWASSGP